MSLPQVEASVVDLSKFATVVKLVAFHPFQSGINALDNINAISEGRLSPDDSLGGIGTNASLCFRCGPWWSSYLSRHQFAERKEAFENDSWCRWFAYRLDRERIVLHYVSTHRRGARTPSRWADDGRKRFQGCILLFVGLRLHFPNLVKGLTDQNQNKAQLGLGHAYSRAKVKFNVNRVDNMIIQSIALLDQLDKDINTFSMRIR